MPAAPAARPLSRRDKQLARLKARRIELTKRREDMLDDIVSGCSYAYLAEKHKISVRTVRREVDRALDHRHLDRPDRYVRVQVERLTNAIKCIDRAILAGDYLAVDPLLKVIEKLDRYHALPWPHPAAAPARLQATSAPLALTDARDSKAQSIP
jgi:DNA-binding CsgD family transcriptional regulator